MEARDEESTLNEHEFGQSQDEHNSSIDPVIQQFLIKGMRALIAGNGLAKFHKHLAKKLYILDQDRFSEADSEYNPNDEMQRVMLDTWTEELMRFLALKTITNDISEPCFLLPGFAVGVAWKALMLTPSIYSKVCFAMGNSNIFDHDPSDTGASVRNLKEKHKIKRHNVTLRAYDDYFDSHPPSLYWNFHKKESSKKKDDIFTSIIRQCGVETSFITDPFATEVTTEIEKPMSPKMPLYDNE